MIATKKGTARALARQAAEVDLAATLTDAATAEQPITSKAPRSRGRRRADVVKAAPKVIHAPGSPRVPTLQAGTKLIKVFHGTRHVVVVREDGRFEWKGQYWKSLSAVACAISKQHVSGPRFFGLVGPKPKAVKP